MVPLFVMKYFISVCVLDSIMYLLCLYYVSILVSIVSLFLSLLGLYSCLYYVSLFLSLLCLYYVLFCLYYVMGPVFFESILLYHKYSRNSLPFHVPPFCIVASPSGGCVCYSMKDIYCSFFHCDPVYIFISLVIDGTRSLLYPVKRAGRYPYKTVYLVNRKVRYPYKTVYLVKRFDIHTRRCIW